jgi:cold shock CspA family protein
VHLTLPDGRDVYADRNPKLNHAHEDVYVAIRDVFMAARRKLQDEARLLRGDVKHREGPPHAVVGTLLTEENYGFLETEDGREIYFHRNSVANGGFDRLSVGARVAFSEAEGEKGPQATFVRPL